MTKKPPSAQIDDNPTYNCSNESDHASAPGPGKIDVIIPAQISEFSRGAARALLRLLIEAHRKRTTDNEQSTEAT